MGEWNEWMDSENLNVKRVSVCEDSTLRQLQQVKWHLGIFLYVKNFWRLCSGFLFSSDVPDFTGLLRPKTLCKYTNTSAVILHSQHCHKRRY